MGRRSGPELTREHADKIVRKLGAKLDTSRSNHDLATFFHKGQAVIQFSLRRSSRKDTGHGHLTEDLKLTAFHVQRLANCPMSLDEFVTRLKDLKIIPVEEEDPPPTDSAD